MVGDRITGFDDFKRTEMPETEFLGEQIEHDVLNG